ncbi:MAG: zinc dependent phospholipase C family protein, partial [Clostridiales bacterium]|nr:zinc dependent phospholipase C family protein [Clostridiales bacterium]
MPFPLTHLCVAWHIIEKSGSKNAAQFILGSIAPDAVHHREEFINGYNPSIGAEKKITHLCPISDERWGHVTDNEGWEERVKKFLREHANNAFAAGYAAHVLTDICNNKTLWYNFRTNFPQEAVKGYTSE